MNQVCELPKQLTFRETIRIAEGATYLGQLYEAAVRMAITTTWATLQPILYLYQLLKKPIKKIGGVEIDILPFYQSRLQ